MSFANPIWLLLLLLIPAAVAVAYAARRRSRRYAVRFTATPALRAAAAADTARWTRYVPAGMLLLAIAALAVTISRPQVSEQVPVKKATIVMVTDHSGSMDATDVAPSRLGAAKKAANQFIDKLPAETLLGAVAYSASPDTVQAPTTAHDATRRVIDAQQALGGTATGNALQTALGLARAQHDGGPAAIVLLSDGATTVGVDPVGVAAQDGEKKIPIYTVALGTTDATIPNPDDPAGPGISVPPDPETLRQIADVSGGRAFSAQSDQELSSIYQSLGSKLGHTTKKHDVGATWALVSLFLLAGAALGAVATQGRVSV